MRTLQIILGSAVAAAVIAQPVPRGVDDALAAFGVPRADGSWSSSKTHFGSRCYSLGEVRVYYPAELDVPSSIIYTPKRTEADDGRVRHFHSDTDVVRYARARLQPWNLSPSWVATVAAHPDPQNTEPAHWTVLFRDIPPAPAVGVGINNMGCKIRMRDGQILSASRSARVTYEPAGDLVSEAEIRSKAQAMGAAPDATIYLQYLGLNEAQQALVGRTVPKLTVVLAYVVNLENRTQAVFEARTGIQIKTMGPGSAAPPAPPAEQPKTTAHEVKAPTKAATAHTSTPTWPLPVGILTVLAGIGAFVFRRARTTR